MIVEFIGSTGAGKSTLLAKVRQRLEAHEFASGTFSGASSGASTSKKPVASAFEVIARPFGLNHIQNSSIQNLIQELLGLPYFLGSLPKYKALVSFSLRTMVRQSKFSLFTINNFRSLIRKIGVYEILSHQQRQQIVLVDEGTVLFPHNLLVFTDNHYTQEEITTVGRLIPLPDLIIYVRAPLDSLVQRTLERPNPPRELRHKDRAVVEHFVQRALQLFDELVTNETIRQKTLIIENPNTLSPAAFSAQQESIVEQVTQYILHLGTS